MSTPEPRVFCPVCRGPAAPQRERLWRFFCVTCAVFFQIRNPENAVLALSRQAYADLAPVTADEGVMADGDLMAGTA